MWIICSDPNVICKAASAHDQSGFIVNQKIDGKSMKNLWLRFVLEEKQ